MTDGEIPQVRLDNEDVWDEVAPLLRDLVDRGAFTLGEELAEFEQAVARWIGCEWCVGVSSGTAALTLALRSARLPPRSRVAIPANTFFATLEAVVAAGHQAVVIDNDEDYVIDCRLLEQMDLDAVIPVHLYGLPADMGTVMELARMRSWWVLEDACQAHGATVGGRLVGSLGHAAAFSAYPTKNLGAWGDAGFVTGSDQAVGASIRSLRHHSQIDPNEHIAVGGTERMDNLQAVVLLAKLKRLDEEIHRRRRVADWYRESLAGSGLDLPGDRGDRGHVFHQFVIRVPNRDQMREKLSAAGIGTAVHYPMPVHLQPGAKGLAVVEQRPERAESWAELILSLPLFPSMTRAQVERVCAEVTANLKL